jgi:hypothetical protein
MASENRAWLLRVENEYGSLKVISRVDFSFFGWRMASMSYELALIAVRPRGLTKKWA